MLLQQRKIPISRSQLQQKAIEIFNILVGFGLGLFDKTDYRFKKVVLRILETVNEALRGRYTAHSSSISWLFASLLIKTFKSHLGKFS